MALLKDSTERREHFRINDTVLLDYKVIDHDTAEKLGKRLANPLLEDEQQQTQLRSLQTAFTMVTDQINHYDREVARALRLLNEKIDIISRNIHKQQTGEESENKTIEVNLSGGGFAFLASDPMEAKTPLAVAIGLQSSHITIDAVAHLIACKQVESDDPATPYLYRLAFTYMNEVDRSLLIKHILTRQAEELRANKLNNI